MSKTNTILIGEGSLLIECAKKLLDKGIVISGVVAANPTIRNWAQGVEIPQHEQLSDVADGSFDWLLSISNLRMLSSAELAKARQGAVNFHDGPLPEYAGLNTPVWAILNDEKRHGITWHHMVAKADAGAVLATREFDIAANETALTLNAKCYEQALDAFDDVVAALLSGQTEGQPIKDGKRHLYRRDDLPETGGFLDPTGEAAAAARLVRALDHGEYWNPLTLPKLRIDGRDFAVKEAAIKPAESSAGPGQVLSVDGKGITVQFKDAALAFSEVIALDGQAAEIARGAKAECPVEMPQAAKSDAFWRDQMQKSDALRTGLATDKRAEACEQVVLDRKLSPAEALATMAMVGQLAQQGETIAYRGSDWQAAGFAPLTLSLDLPLKPAEALAAMNRLRGQFVDAPSLDLPFRDPAINALETPEVGYSEAGPLHGIALTLCNDREQTILHFDPSAFSRDAQEILAKRFEHALELLSGEEVIDAATVLPPLEKARLTKSMNGPEVALQGLTIKDMFEAEVAGQPDRPALHFRHQTLSYATLNARANLLAERLISLDVGPGVFVGVHLERSVEMLVSVLAILKAGGAYLPLDPNYPEERIAHYVADSQCAIVLGRSAKVVPGFDGIHLDPTGAEFLVSRDPGNPESRARPEDLAYAIYTSGSTGLPKGVMVEHRNVENFFVGMDAHVTRGEDDAWLALTSLSFDISVLELLYTLCRGIRLVLASDDQAELFHDAPMSETIGGMDFGLYFWGNDDGPGPQKYRLLLESAKFADMHGFTSVWTPERHFHAFGGPYPNPSVTGAAVAAVTRNLAVRAGSCVAPLHHTARVAEEWAVIDNLTNGRAGLGIAAGWQPDDFLLRPENAPPNNKEAMLRSIADLRALWRGEPVAFDHPDGSRKEVITQPRPVSKELPLWLTIAGNPDTWREAGRVGAHVLTHLLGQSVEEVGEKIAIYHAALSEAGHDPKDFQITLMLHSFVGHDRDEVRDIVRGPMKDYLTSAAGLIKQCAWAFPAFKKPEGVTNPFEIDLETLNAEELDAILEFAFNRYFDESGLFGTVEDCLARVAEVKALGVTEVACLIDFGIAPDVVLEGLKPLAEVVARANVGATERIVDASLAGLIAAHGVTHLQSTPSMARMISADERALKAVRGLRQYLIGGEALNGALADQIAGDSHVDLSNMYGPTETTIWSTVETIGRGEGVVNIGHPISNTTTYVLAGDGRVQGFGQNGELWIGGQGVTRGYWQRPDLTAEKFREDPFVDGGRIYGTGDLVRRRPDGKLDFVGRVDSQVKLRGYRIELGEVEAVLCRQSIVREAVVEIRETAQGEAVLAAFVKPEGPFNEARLRQLCKTALPQFMQPQVYVETPDFPLTPNRKIDRKALVLPRIERPAQAEIAPVKGTGDPRAVVSAVWCEILGLPEVSLSDSFFDLGGHSLLAIQAHRELKARLGLEKLAITDIFRFPVLASLADHIVKLSTDSCERNEIAPVAAKAPRAEQRVSAMDRRRLMREQRKANRADV